MTVELSEKYVTIAGEAPISGEPVFLVRFAGCNLSCDYCDTKYAREAKESTSEDTLKQTILSSVEQYPKLKVLLTGGEPLFGERQTIILRIVRSLPDIEFYIETNGSVRIEDFSLPSCSYVVDLKTPSSGHEHSLIVENLDCLRPDLDCIKIVLAENDFRWAASQIAVIHKKNPGLPIYLSPQWNRVSLPSLADFILSNKLPARISVQLHKMIWGADVKGV